MVCTNILHQTSTSPVVAYNIYQTAQPASDDQDQPSITTVEALPSSDFGQLINILSYKW